MSAAATEPCADGAVCGTVLDPKGNALALAEVSLRIGDRSYRTVTSEAGRFVLDPAGFDAGARLRIEAIGYAPLTRTIDPAQADRLRLVMRPKRPPVEEIIVSAREISRPFAQRVLPKLKILTDPQSRSDPLLAIANMPAGSNVNDAADLQLRGSEVGLSRVYFNDIPLYELVRGSTIDRVTRGSSILNPGIVEEMEIYPTNAPLYLGNSAGGAARILPGVVPEAPSSLFVGLTGATLTSAASLGGVGRVEGYGGYTNLAPFLALNPNQERVTSAFESGSLGASWELTPADDTDLQFLTLADFEDGTFPLAVLNRSGPSSTERRRLYLTGSVTQPVGSARIKVDTAVTRIRTDFSFGGGTQADTHRYLYGNADIAGPLFGGMVRYRTGLSTERFDLNSTGATGLSAGFGAGPDRARDVAETYVAAYGFLTVTPWRNVSLAFGTRQFPAGPDQSASYSGTLSVHFDDRRHSVILGGGTYSALVPGQIGTQTRIDHVRSEQVSLDYDYDGRVLTAKFGAFAKRDIVDGVATRIRGIDAQLDVSPLSWAEFGASVASFDADTQGFRGTNDLKYLVRLSARFNLSPTAQLNLAFVQRSGAVFTDIVDGRRTPSGAFAPVFSPTVNGERLNTFRTVDVNIVDTLHIWPGEAKPLIFIAATNLLNRRNQARAVYSRDYGEQRFAFHELRAVLFGLVFSF